jgi:[ribosomal protein S18]-alanine N-acetyltransferase
MDVSIRWLIRVDMPEVLAIEREAFSRQWSEEDFLSYLRQKNCIGMVARQGKKVIGFMIYELCPKWLQLHRFAVARTHRRVDVGTALIDQLIGKLSLDRRVAIGTSIPEENLEAQLFFRSQGFKSDGIVEDCTEAGEPTVEYLMKYDISPVVFAPTNRITQYIKEPE